MSDMSEQQYNDELEQQFYLLAALQRIDRAGFHDEALLFAFHGGVLSQFKKAQAFLLRLSKRHNTPAPIFSIEHQSLCPLFRVSVLVQKIRGDINDLTRTTSHCWWLMKCIMERLHHGKKSLPIIAKIPN